MTKDGLVDEVDDVDVVVDAVQQEVIFTGGADAVGGKTAAQGIAGAGSAGRTPGERRARNVKVRWPPRGSSLTWVEFRFAP